MNKVPFLLCSSNIARTRMVRCGYSAVDALLLHAGVAQVTARNKN